MADLEIVYRQGHSRVSDYVDGGRDATIDSGRIDFQWKNNTGSPIYVLHGLSHLSSKCTVKFMVNQSAAKL